MKTYKVPVYGEVHRDIIVQAVSEEAAEIHAKGEFIALLGAFDAAVVVGFTEVIND